MSGVSDIWRALSLLAIRILSIPKMGNEIPELGNMVTLLPCLALAYNRELKLVKSCLHGHEA